MKKTVMLSLRGTQRYMDQEPEIIELVTEGTLEQVENGWQLIYEETALTGLEGVTTTFMIHPGEIILSRTGKLKSEMVFRVGEMHDSLYQMEFGALMITVCATKVDFDICENAFGVVDLVYGIEIEHSEGGVIEYHLEIQPK